MVTDHLHQQFIETEWGFMLQREDTAGCGLGIVCIHKKGIQASIGKKTGKVSSKRGFAFSTFGRDNGKYCHFAHPKQWFGCMR
ncbi:hypothetical protein Y071_03490 [Salmonella enterica subsp. enterica serovar Infantis str. CVM N20078]|nr:hypothetical protein Y071_03490 [Salmonella enterica subsp. enterica serovar Infantis str. CVM N20078]